MNRSKILAALGACALFFGTAASAQQVYNCVLGSAPEISAGEAGPDISQDVEEIQNSCNGLMVPQDSTRLKVAAWDQCCHAADSYVKRKPIPPKGAEGDAATLNRWAAYRVRLALSVCDGIRDSSLSYQRNLCLTDMLFRIPDPRVTAILNECSPVGHNVKDGRHRHHGGGGKGEGSGRGGQQASGAQTPSGKAAPDTPDNPLGAANSTDLLLGDEAFAKCQHDKLGKFVERITGGADESSSSKKRM